MVGLMVWQATVVAAGSVVGHPAAPVVVVAVAVVVYGAGLWLPRVVASRRDRRRVRDGDGR